MSKMLLFPHHNSSPFFQTCDDDPEVIEAYVSDRLEAAETETFESHLLVCGCCRQAVIEQDQFCDALKGVLSAEAEARTGARQTVG